MDDLVLAAAALSAKRSLAGAIVADVFEEPGSRLRLVFESGPARRSWSIGYAPALPWFGRAVARERTRVAPGSLASACIKGLKGRVLEEAGREQPSCLTLRFAGGVRLVAELIPSRANTILISEDGTITAIGRATRRPSERLLPGAVYRPPTLPPDRADVLSALQHEGPIESGDGIDGDAISSRFVGLGRDSVALAVEEARLEGVPALELLRQRAAAILAGEIVPVIEAIENPLAAAERGELDPATCRLLPWRPRREPIAGFAYHEGEDAAATAGLYYEAMLLRARLDAHLASLRSVLGREIGKTQRARAAVEEDAARFADPERHRLHAEALLSGLSSARRLADHVLVPDPYDIEGRRSLSIPAPPGRSLQDVATQLFKTYRRAQRGLDSARERAARLDRRRASLAEAASRFAEARPSLDTVQALERALREAGVPVGLERRRTRGEVAPAKVARARVEGIRLLRASDGSEILVGRGGRENDRLTFKLAGPDDFWFHARDVPGAHVIVRNPTRQARPAERLCREAAAVAAWFSDAKGQTQADVLWTRRKYVRRAKGVPIGTVKVKKSETLRVRPALPEGAEG